MNNITIIRVSNGGMLDSLMWLQSYTGYFWLIVAIAFLFSELAAPGLFFFISFSVGAFCAAGLAFFGHSFFAQCTIGLVVSMATFLVMRKFLQRKKLSEVEYGSSITNIDAIAGRTGVVVNGIKPHFKGVVRIGGELWRARGEGGVILEAGAIVKILRVEGNTVVVKPIESGESNDNA
ncbi:NfeD family protein [Candidatus Dependentiae bacterium]|nr:NfeD family protein [Candidatus Dependentiae bacterium]